MARVKYINVRVIQLLLNINRNILFIQTIQVMFKLSIEISFGDNCHLALSVN